MNPASTPRQAGAEPSDVIYPMPPALARNLSNKSLCHLADEGSASPAIPAYRPNSRFVARAGSDHFEAGPHRVENCVICLERLRANGDDATTVPCGCQLRLETPSKMHVQCLRAWVNACAKRASNDIGLERAPTCPLCRAQFTDDAVFNLMIAPRPRLCLQMRPCEFALEALQPADGALRCVVRVLDRAQRRRWANLASSDAAPLLALNVEGLCGPNGAPRRGSERPLLIARAPRRLGTSRLATRFEIVVLDPRCSDDDEMPPTGTVAAHLTRNWKGTKWAVHDGAAKGGATRCTVEYAVNRLANRPRSMFVQLGDGSGAAADAARADARPPEGDAAQRRGLRSRAPEYNSQLQGFCLDFFGRARLASVRNFQIVDSGAGAPLLDDETRCLLLFGRWSPDEFHLDVKAPFSLVDAFAVAVSSYATKLATI